MNSRDTNTIRRRPLCLIGIFAAFLAGPQLQLATASFVATTFFGSRQKTIPSILYSHYETKKEPLIPEDNPEADPNIESKAGVRYGTVLSGLNRLFSPEELEKRNAISRSDGYWPYINDEDGPPLEFTYGEFDFYFFAELLDRILQYTNDDNWDGKVFVDIGSGTGRLVFAAAALHSHWKKCRGIELLPGLNKAAEDTLDQCCLAKHKEPPVPEKKLPKSNELWIPSIQSIGGDNAFSGGKPLIQSLSDDDWLSNLQNQFDEDEEDEFDEGHAEDKKQSAFTYADTENLESDIGIDSTEACGDESFDDEGDHQVNTETDKSSEEPRSGLFCPQDENASKDEGETIGLAPIEFVQGSFDDPFMYFSDADLVFSFASAFPKDVMKKLSRTIGTKCKPGTVVVTIDHNLDHVGVIEPSVSQDYGFDLPTGPYKLDLLEQLDGWCWLTGGISTAYIYRVETSLWEQQEQIQGPTLRDRAFQAVKLAEAEKLANAQQFLRGVYNNMVFYGFPESWRPKLESIPYEKYLVEFQYY